MTEVVAEVDNENNAGNERRLVVYEGTLGELTTATLYSNRFLYLPCTIAPCVCVLWAVVVPVLVTNTVIVIP